MSHGRGIRVCHHCGRGFGTQGVFDAHNGKRGCLGNKALQARGYWKGFAGKDKGKEIEIWWGKDMEELLL